MKRDVSKGEIGLVFVEVAAGNFMLLFKQVNFPEQLQNQRGKVIVCEEKTIPNEFNG